MIAHSKIVLALLGIAFLLCNPAGVCAGTPSSHSPSHPCCPRPSTPNQGSGTGACVCIDRQPAAPAVPALDAGHITPVVVTVAPKELTGFRNETLHVPDRASPALEARFLAFHQILV